MHVALLGGVFDPPHLGQLVPGAIGVVQEADEADAAGAAIVA